MQKKIEVVYIPLGDLLPDPKNPRRNDAAVSAVRESIEEFGFRVPIVIDKDMIIRAGHTRYKAAKELGMERVPCIIASDLSEKELKAFQLADNKTGELASWDLSMLNMELSDLADIFDMSLFGFNKKTEDKTSTSTGSTGSAESQYIKCPRCGRMFLKSEGHPQARALSFDEDGGDDEWEN